MRKVALAAAVVSLLSGAAAQAATHYSGILFFGDSLSDDGNLYELTSATIGLGIPPAPYFEGRSSNGLVWADHIAADFTAKGLHSANYAYAYGQAVTNVDTQFPGGFQVPDLPAQIDAFKASGTESLLGDRPVATLWVGANDLFNAMPNGFDAVAVAATAAASAIAGGIELLAETGIRDFVVFNMPPLEKTPLFAASDTPPQVAALAAFGTGLFNATLKGLLDSAGPDTRITKIDIHAVMDALIADPAAFGVQRCQQSLLQPDHQSALLHPGAGGAACLLGSGAPDGGDPRRDRRRCPRRYRADSGPGASPPPPRRRGGPCLGRDAPPRRLRRLRRRRRGRGG